jgi:hypothetical protein
MRWVNDKVLPSRCKAGSVARLEHLYSTEIESQEPDTRVEREFMGPKVDDPAARALNTLLTSGVTSLSDSQREDWARFLVCQMIRVPGMVAHIRLRGREILMEDMEPDFVESIQHSEHKQPLSQYVLQHAPSLFDDLGIMTLPHIVRSSKLNQVFLDAHWMLKSVRRARFDLLIGDKPLIYEGQMNNDFLFALPVTPNMVFFTFNSLLTGTTLKSLTDTGAVCNLNRQSVVQANASVFSTGDGQISFVAKYLRKTDLE